MRRPAHRCCSGSGPARRTAGRSPEPAAGRCRTPDRRRAPPPGSGGEDRRVLAREGGGVLLVAGLARRSAGGPDDRLDLSGAGEGVGPGEAEIDRERLLGRGGGGGHGDRRRVGHGRGGETAREGRGEGRGHDDGRDDSPRAARHEMHRHIRVSPSLEIVRPACAGTRPRVRRAPRQPPAYRWPGPEPASSSQPLQRVSRARVADMRSTETTGGAAVRPRGARSPRDARASSNRRESANSQPGWVRSARRM